jgi:hypothetical protein
MLKRVANPETGKFRCFEMTEDEYRELGDNNQGLCIACGEVRDCCEPDATKYECEACEKHAVYGTEELMMMGRIKIVAFVEEP